MNHQRSRVIEEGASEGGRRVPWRQTLRDPWPPLPCRAGSARARRRGGVKGAVTRRRCKHSAAQARTTRRNAETGLCTERGGGGKGEEKRERLARTTRTHTHTHTHTHTYTLTHTHTYTLTHTHNSTKRRTYVDNVEPAGHAHAAVDRDGRRGGVREEPLSTRGQRGRHLGRKKRGV